MKKLFPLAALAAVFTSPTALAEATTSPPEPSLSSVVSSILVSVVPVLATALAALIVSGLTGLTRKFQAQAGESKLALVAARVSMLAEGIVRDIEVTMKPKLEAAAADGELTPAEFQQLKDEALQRLLKSLGDRGLAELQQVLQLTAGSVGSFLSGLIEAALDKMKADRGGSTVDDVMTAALSLGAIGSTAAVAPAVAAVPQTPRGS
ncbi:hypothetical protein [Myxococcus sp. CA039A]|uniref:hypothetical protein n=1 Tax=Myxococcus sp. CA039A TaxID=2741737 RepID=UPI00157BB164|nr:hypothetical protein [Myxococcus sp. CA039A]NTX54608.1 hypothetical protein [Myxococcus sp. CA039A]